MLRSLALLGPKASAPTSSVLRVQNSAVIVWQASAASKSRHLATNAGWAWFRVPKSHAAQQQAKLARLQRFWQRSLGELGGGLQLRLRLLQMHMSSKKARGMFRLLRERLSRLGLWAAASGLALTSALPLVMVAAPLAGDGGDVAGAVAGSPVHAVGAASSDEEMGEGETSDVDVFLEAAVPFLQQLGFAGVVGYATGFAVKELGRQLAYGIGVSVLCLQGLAYLGYVDVHWKRVEEDVKDKLDLNNDGKVDKDDLKVGWNKLLEALSFGMASTAGFTAGLYMGLGF